MSVNSYSIVFPQFVTSCSIFQAWCSCNLFQITAPDLPLLEDGHVISEQFGPLHPRHTLWHWSRQLIDLESINSRKKRWNRKTLICVMTLSMSHQSYELEIDKCGSQDAWDVFIIYGLNFYQLFLFLANKLAVIGLSDHQMQYLSGSSFVSVSLSLFWSDWLDVFHIVFFQLLGLVSVTAVLICQDEQGFFECISVQLRKKILQLVLEPAWDLVLKLTFQCSCDLC